MIPFDVDPSGYYMIVICLFLVFVAIVVFLVDNTDAKLIWGIFACLFIIMAIIIGFAFIIGGSTYTNTIKICKHIQTSNDMTVIDTNENVYYVRDVVTKFKVVDNEKVNVKIKEQWGYKWIYSIDAPITCGNQTCGVPP
jgi:uncharacterized integral membrane protein